jgi:lipase chaperone LimK
MDLWEEVNILRQRVENAAEMIERAQKDYYRASKELMDAKHSLDNEIAQAIVTGVSGKNAEERAARLKVTYADKQDNVVRLENAKADMKLELDLAHNEMTRTKLQVRLVQDLVRLRGFDALN